MIHNEPSLALFHQIEAFIESQDYGEMFGFNIEGGYEEPASISTTALFTPSDEFSINLEEGELLTSLPESFSLRMTTEETVIKQWPGITKLTQIFDYYFEFIPKVNIVSFLHEVCI